MQTYHAGEGEILSFSVDPGHTGKVRQKDTKFEWTVSAGSSLNLGPGEYVTLGNVKATRNGEVVAALVEQLPARTERVVSERIVTAAIQDGLQYRKEKAMAGSLAEKARLLAARAKEIPIKHGVRLDDAALRLTDADDRADRALTRLETGVIADVENSAIEIEDVANQISNVFGETGNG